MSKNKKQTKEPQRGRTKQVGTVMDRHATHSLLGRNTCSRSLAFTCDTNTPVYIHVLNKTAQQGEWGKKKNNVM